MHPLIAPIRKSWFVDERDSRGIDGRRQVACDVQALVLARGQIVVRQDAIILACVAGVGVLVGSDDHL